MKLVLAQRLNGLLVHLDQRLVGVAFTLGFVKQIAHFGRPDHGVEDFQVLRPLDYLFALLLDQKLHLDRLLDKGNQRVLLLLFELFHGLIELIRQTLVLGLQLVDLLLRGLL